MWGWINSIPEYTPFKKRYILRAQKNDEYMTFVLEMRNEKQARKYVMFRGYDVLYVDRLSNDALSVQNEDGDVIHFSKKR